MAILTGFPPSNTVQLGTRFPKVVKKRSTIANMKYGDRFIHQECEYYMLPDHDGFWSSTAICYRSKNDHDLGRLAGFDKKAEVVHLFEDWNWQMEDDPDL